LTSLLENCKNYDKFIKLKHEPLEKILHAQDSKPHWFMKEFC